MKRVQKNILGISGLAIVAAMTAFAAILPAPEVSATTSLTDTLTVRVVEAVPNVDISTTAQKVVTEEVYPYDLTYEFAQSVYTMLEYTDADGEKHVYEGLEAFVDADYDFGEKSLVVDLKEVHHFDDGYLVGYGDYTIVAKAIALDGTPYYDYLDFTWIPVEGKLLDGEDPIVEVTAMGYNVDAVKVVTRDGVQVGYATRSYLQNISDGLIALNLDEVGCQETLYLYAYEDDVLLYNKPYVLTTTCPEIPDTGAPDTGGLFQNLNISKEDYLVTGLIIFFILGIVGFGIVARNKRTTNKKRR